MEAPCEACDGAGLMVVSRHPRRLFSPDFSIARAILKWCERSDSNRHGVNRWNLNPVRLPVPPRSQSRIVKGVVRPERLERPTLRFEA